MRVGGRAEGEDATAHRHGETASLPVDSGEARPALDDEHEVLRADAGDSGLIVQRPDEPMRGTPPVIAHSAGTAGVVARQGSQGLECYY